MGNCPQCGEPTDTLYEGVCEECRGENQGRLAEFQRMFERWEGLTEKEKWAEIRRVLRGAV